MPAAVGLDLGLDMWLILTAAHLLLELLQHGDHAAFVLLQLIARDELRVVPAACVHRLKDFEALFLFFKQQVRYFLQELGIARVFAETVVKMGLVLDRR